MGSKPAKVETINEIKENIRGSSVAIATDYRGLSVEEITTLRRGLQEKGAEYTVVKNTLAKIAIKETEYEGLSEYLVGPTALVLATDDPVGPAKVVTQFLKKAKKGSVKGGLMDGKPLTEKEIVQLSEIPSKEELYAKLLGSINSPATGLTTCINGVARALVSCIDQIREQKEKA
ncbi:MAG: 50S ribosomal protein L10 [Vampirovibrionia bacterium]